MLQTSPSGEAVERLFTCVGQILVPCRCQVSNDMFKKIVFCATNSSRLFWHRYIWRCLIL